MRRWRWALLVVELFLFTLILVLPQVDLPDCTFHSGTAPVIAKAKMSSPPVLAVVAPVFSELLRRVRPVQTHQIGSHGYTPTKSALSLLCILLC